MALKLFLSLFTLIHLSSFAQHEGFNKVTDVEKLLKTILEASEKTKTVKAYFEQEKNSTVLAEKAISKGIFYFKKPALIKMEYQKPFEYLVLITNGNVTIKEGKNIEKINAGTSKLFRQINEIIVQSADGSISKNKNYLVNFFESNTEKLIALQPKNKRMKAYISLIEVYFDKKDFSVNRFKLIEASGDDLTVRFFNKEMNKPILDGVFE